MQTILPFGNTNCRDYPKRPRGNPTEHPSMGHVAHQLSIWIPSGEHTALSKPAIWTTPSLVRTYCPDPALATQPKALAAKRRPSLSTLLEALSTGPY